MTSPFDSSAAGRPGDASSPAGDAAAGSAQGSVLDDIVEIFHAPTRVFERRRDGRFGIALLIYLVLMIVLTVAMFMSLGHAVEADMLRGFERGGRAGQLDAEMIDRMLRFGVMIAPIGFAFAIAIGVFLVGVAIWLVGKLFDATLTLGLALVVATYSQFPRLIGSVIATLQGLFGDPARHDTMMRVLVSPVRFMDPDTTSPAVMALLARVELFTVWATVLIGIGIHVVGRVPKGQAFAAAFIIWVLGSLPGLLQAL